MTLRMADTGNPVTAEQLIALEADLGTRLPTEYRRFLLEHNGGVPHPNTVDIDGLAGTPTDVQEFFGIELEIETSNLGWQIKEISEQLPDGLLPVACDSGGNLFCIVLPDGNPGAVHYVDLAEDNPKQYFVAANFAEFLAKIRK